MPFRDHWRDVQCLHDDGIPIDTTNNETAKLFDAALTQYTGWYNDQNMDGIESTVVRLIQSDPTCIASRILATGLELLSTSIPASSAHAKTLETLGDTTTTDPYVSLHTQALLDWSLGHHFKAAHTWEQILVRYPYDMMAIKFVSDTYFYVGDREMLRDSIARVLPIWEASPDRPLKSYLYGMYAFGLGETNMIARAEKEARYGLELNPHDAWATHALAHALEYAGQPWQGIDFLSQTRRDWEQCDLIKPHIDWHEALYELEQGNRESAEEGLQAYLASRENQMIMLDFVDIASLIYRLRLAGSANIPDVPSSHQFKHFLNDHLHDHSLFFNDLHIYFVIDDFADEQARADFSRSLAEAYETADTDNARVYRRVGKRILHAIDAFREKDYSRVVDLLYPIRNEIYRVGGSNAQRDVFGLLLLHCAVHSPELEHRLLAKQLINERCWLRNKTKSRMMENYANSILSD